MIQQQFDKAALNCLPRIITLIKNAASFESNQMRCKALYCIMDSIKAITDMCPEEIKSFEDELIRIFKYKEWI